MCCINVYHWLAIQQNLFVGKFSESIIVIRRFLFKMTYLLRYKFSLWEEERAMWAMLRYSHFVKKSMQAVQTWSNSNSMHVDVLHKTEQRFIACFDKLRIMHMCVWYVTFTSAMLRYSHFVKKSIQAVQTWSNSNSMHVDVLHKTEQRFIAFFW